MAHDRRLFCFSNFVLLCDHFTRGFTLSPRLKQVMEHPSISRQHAAVMHTTEGFAIMDLGSAHGSYIAYREGDSNHAGGHLAGGSAVVEEHTFGHKQTAPLSLPPKPSIPRRRIPNFEPVRLTEGQCVVFGASKRVYTLRFGDVLSGVQPETVPSPLVHTLHNSGNNIFLEDHGREGNISTKVPRTVSYEHLTKFRLTQDTSLTSNGHSGEETTSGPAGPACSRDGAATAAGSKRKRLVVFQ